MTQPRDPKTGRFTTKALPPMSREDIVEVARGLATGKWLHADLTRPAWQSSLALIFAFWEGELPPNLAAIVVPVAPHMGGWWVNGEVPGATVECRFVPEESLDELNAEIGRMVRALHPDD